MKLFKKRKRKKKPKWRHFSTFNGNSQLNSNEIPHWQKLKVRRLKWQKLKIRVLKWKMLKIRGSVLNFCQLFIIVSGCHLLVSDYRYQEWQSQSFVVPMPYTLSAVIHTSIWCVSVNRGQELKNPRSSWPFMNVTRYRCPIALFIKTIW